MATTLAEVVGFAEARPDKRVFVEASATIFADLTPPATAQYRPRGDVFVSARLGTSQVYTLLYSPLQPRRDLWLPRRASLSGHVDFLNNKTPAPSGTGITPYNGDAQSFLVNPPARERWYLDLFFGPRRPPVPELHFAEPPPEIVVYPPWRTGFTFPLVQDGAFLRGQADGFVQPMSATQILVLLGRLGVETVIS